MPPLLRLPVVMSLKNFPFSSAVAFLRSVACRWLAAHPRLQSYPAWVPVETVRERLRELVEDLHTPELFLVLDTDCDDSVEWKCFRADASFHGTIEDGIASLYLAHLAQWSRADVYAPDGSIVAPSDRLVLDPQLFVDYLENKRSDLKNIIDFGETTLLDPRQSRKGDWRNRREICKWQNNLFVWFKKTKPV